MGFSFPDLIPAKFLVFRTMTFWFFLYVDFVSYYFGECFKVGGWGMGEWERGVER